MYKLVVYDLDGTLINSLDDLADCMNIALQSVSLKPYKVDEYRYFVGQGVANLVKDTINRQTDNADLQPRVKEVFDREYAEKSLNKTAPYSGVTEMLRELQSKGVGQAVLSNKPQQFINTIAEKLLSSISFSALWGKKPMYNIKPDPQSLLALIAELNIPRSQCLYVGDSNVDVFTANNAKVDFCGVSWGFRGTKELKAAGADVVVDTPQQLMEYILNE